jgi:TolB-like protein
MFFFSPFYKIKITYKLIALWANLLFLLVFSLIILENSVEAKTAELPDMNDAQRLPIAPTEHTSPDWLKLSVGEIGLSAADNAVYSGKNGYCRLKFSNGDIIHQGPLTLANYNIQNGELIINLWHGKIMLYGSIRIKGTKKITIINTPHAKIEFENGKIGITASSKNMRTRLYTFAGAALWKNGNKGGQLSIGNMVEIGKTYSEKVVIDKNSVKILTQLTSPEASIVKNGLHEFLEKNYEQAKTILKMVQANYPLNGPAAYHLGIIYNQQALLDAAIRQWQIYLQAEPEQAKEKNISQHLTVMINKKFKKEIENALANEEQVSNSRPEPESVAVSPLSVTKDSNRQDRLIAKGMTAMITSDLAIIPSLKIIERAKLQKLLKEIRMEQRLSQEELMDSEHMIRAGKLLKAEKLIIGNCSTK